MNTIKTKKDYSYLYALGTNKVVRRNIAVEYDGEQMTMRDFQERVMLSDVVITLYGLDWHLCDNDDYKQLVNELGGAISEFSTRESLVVLILMYLNGAYSTLYGQYDVDIQIEIKGFKYIGFIHTEKDDLLNAFVRHSSPEQSTRILKDALELITLLNDDIPARELTKEEKEEYEI